MKTSMTSMVLHLFFGLLFCLIGFVNTFWGNDPFFGLFIILLSMIFWLPIVQLIMDKLSQKQLLIVKIVIGVFILWSSLGVGELFQKVTQMRNSFPNPVYEYPSE